MSPFEFELRKQRLQELINAELLRRGVPPETPYKPNPYVYRSDPEIIDVEWVEVVPATKAEKPAQPSLFYFLWLGTLIILTGALAIAII